jgi:endonuclease/exonuclease/phosphatase family metal-dependent hydrolase
MRAIFALILPLLCVSLLPAAEPVRVMTYNIRYNNPGDGENAWPHRRDWVGQIIRDEKVDILGVQEATAGQMKDLRERLPDYDWYGAGREDGKERGEFVPLFWKKDRFEVVDKGLFWLSTTPDVPGSKGWDTAITRMATWAKLKDKGTGKTYFAINTHFDHRGVEARKESAKLMLEMLPKLAGDLPIVLTGDFNSTPSSEAYAILSGKKAEGKGLLADARAVSKSEPRGPYGTFNNFTRISDQPIDYVFIKGLTAKSHAVLETVKDGKFASDHLPILVEVE